MVEVISQTTVLLSQWFQIGKDGHHNQNTIAVYHLSYLCCQLSYIFLSVSEIEFACIARRMKPHYLGVSYSIQAYLLITNEPFTWSCPEELLKGSS